MKKLIDAALERLSENSTWRGILLILTAVGLKLEPELQNAILTVGLSAVGLINVVRKGKK
jgi:hypothetical protein